MPTDDRATEPTDAPAPSGDAQPNAEPEQAVAEPAEAAAEPEQAAAAPAEAAAAPEQAAAEPAETAAEPAEAAAAPEEAAAAPEEAAAAPEQAAAEPEQAAAEPAEAAAEPAEAAAAPVEAAAEPEQAAAEPPAAPPEDPVAPFAAIGVSPWLVEALAKGGIIEPTDIQALAIPPLLDGHDIIGQARTGTGKTAAFSVPLLEKVDPNLRAVQALVLAPTRELAVQVSKVLSELGRRRRGLRVVPIYGGSGYGPQLRALDRGAQIVVGTPGRLIDLIDRGALVFDQLRMVVIDEADEMLQMGFVDDIETILDATPKNGEKQVALFSATMPPPIRRIANRHLVNPVDAKTDGAGAAVSAIEQEVVFVDDNDLVPVLDRLLQVEVPEQALMFVATREATSDLASALTAMGHGAAALSGAMTQAHRTDVLHRFRSGRLRILVGTDVAARGLDVDGISHVFNVGPPTDLDSYVHRIGRTGRAGRKGKAITLARARDRRRVRRIEQHTDVIMTRRRWPSAADALARRTAVLVERLAALMENPGELAVYRNAIDALVERGHDPLDIAAAAARMSDGDRPMTREHRQDREMVPFIVGAGNRQRIRPGDIVGSLCNDGGLDRRAIGFIEVDRFFAVVWVARAAAERLDGAEHIYVRGRPIQIWLDGQPPPQSPNPRRQNDRGPRRDRDDDRGAPRGRPGGYDRPRFDSRGGRPQQRYQQDARRGPPERDRYQRDDRGGPRREPRWEDRPRRDDRNDRPRRDDRDDRFRDAYREPRGRREPDRGYRDDRGGPGPRDDRGWSNRDDGGERGWRERNRGPDTRDDRGRGDNSDRPRRDDRGGRPSYSRQGGDRSQPGSGGDTPFSGWKGRQGRRGRSTRHRHDEH